MFPATSKAALKHFIRPTTITPQSTFALNQGKRLVSTTSTTPPPSSPPPPGTTPENNDVSLLINAAKAGADFARSDGGKMLTYVAVVMFGGFFYLHTAVKETADGLKSVKKELKDLNQSVDKRLEGLTELIERTNAEEKEERRGERVARGEERKLAQSYFNTLLTSFYQADAKK